MVREHNFNGNEIEKMMNIEVSHLVFINSTIANNKGGMIMISNSSVSISFSAWQQNSYGISGAWALLRISDSYVRVSDSQFQNNFENFYFPDNLKSIEFLFSLFLIDSNSVVKITRNDFTFNKIALIIVVPNVSIEPKDPDIQVETSDEPLHESYLFVSSCHFEGNVVNDTNIPEFVAFDSGKMFELVSPAHVSLAAISIFSVRSVVFFTKCTVINNYGIQCPGFISLTHSSASITECTFKNNTASVDAGVIEMYNNSTLIIENSSFENNSCGADGGVISCHRNSQVTMRYSTFIENRSFGSKGGVVALEKSKIISEFCTFSGNTATIEGGAIMATDSSTYYDLGSLFFSNTAANKGKILIIFSQYII